MPIIQPSASNPLIDGRQSPNAMMIRRGLERHFHRQGQTTLPELSLATGRRADLVVLGAKGEITIVEIKSSIEDFKVDQKWPEYRAFCDCYYFATHPQVPTSIFPPEEGLIVADGYGAEIIVPSTVQKLSAATRKAMTLRFARAAAQRHAQVSSYALQQGVDIPDEILKIQD